MLLNSIAIVPADGRQSETALARGTAMQRLLASPGSAWPPCRASTARTQTWRLNKKTKTSRKSYLEGVVEFESRIIHK
jgi:hypothetical protein